MDLRAVMDQQAAGRPGNPFDNQLVQRVANFVVPEPYAPSLTSTLLWQVAVRSPGYTALLRAAGASLQSAVRAETFVVAHAQGNFDLLVLDPGFTGSEPSAVDLALRPHDVEFGYRAWMEQRSGELAAWRNRAYAAYGPGGRFPSDAAVQRGDVLTSLLSAVTTRDLLSLVDSMPYRIVVLRPPATELNAAMPPCGVAIEVGGAPVGTVGVGAQDRSGRVGVTVAYHVLASMTGGVAPGSQVVINDFFGTVVSVDVVSDSCFVEIDVDAWCPGLRRVAGPLSGMSPRQNERMHFEGIASAGTAVVSGWSTDIPFVFQYNQLKVLTDAVTEAGDSGAALIDDQNHVVGFSFFRTGVGDSPEFSAWIWADSVFSVHGLTAL